MTSLRELLTEEGFNQTNLTYHSKHKLSRKTKQIISLPSHNLCHDRKSIECSKHKIDKKLHGSASETSNSKSFMSQGSKSAGPPMDAVAIRAVISILSGYIGRYVKDDCFRKTIREKCNAYLIRRVKGSESDDDEIEILDKMKLGIENIDKLVQDQGTKKEELLKIKTLRNSIDLLTIVASLNSRKNNRVCGISNSHDLSACAQLYMAIVYKLQKNKRMCARHLIQVFCDSPFLARTFLVPDLWELLFLPHLLHLQIWYTEELEALSCSNQSHGEKEKKMKTLRKVYDNKVDTGTSMFALYYKQWLKVGAGEPPLPIVLLPSRTSHRSSRKKSSDSFVLHSSINPNLLV